LSINGCQIVGYIGEIMPASPKVDGTKMVGTAPAAGTTQTGTTTAATQPAHAAQ
jgi:hypothetical protein